MSSQVTERPLWITKSGFSDVETPPHARTYFPPPTPIETKKPSAAQRGISMVIGLAVVCTLVYLVLLSLETTYGKALDFTHWAIWGSVLVFITATIVAYKYI